MLKFLINKIKKLLFGKARNGIFYVNGPEMLPPPLSREEEAYALEHMHTDDNARARLIEHNLRLVVYI